MSRSVARQATRRFPRGMFRGAARVACALWLLCALCACQTKAPERSLLSVEPSVIGNNADTIVTLTGQGFLEVPLIALGSSDKLRLRDRYRVSIADVFHTDQVERVNDKQLRFTARRGLAEGSYDVRVEPPLGAAMVLPNVLTIREGSTEPDVDASVPPGRSLSFETSADGAGEVIAERALNVTASLDLFVVFREPDGAVSGEPEAVQFSMLPVLGALDEIDAAHVVFRPSLPGDLRVRAVSTSGLRAEVLVRVTPDAQHGLADYHLSLEDAPSGAGTAYTAERGYAAGTLLECYAVVRDQSGAFVLDMPVDWRVSGAENATRAQASSLSLPLVHAGQVQLNVNHEVLGDAQLSLHVLPGHASQLRLEPESASLRAGGSALSFTVSGQDEFGNATLNLGELAYSLAEGTLDKFDASSATLTPERVGVGRVAVQSSYGASVTSGLIQVTAGPLARLNIEPGTLQLTTDASPVQFEVSGVDAFDNEADVGDVTWSVASGAIGALSTEGVLDPTTVGAGTIRASSSLGVGVVSGPITISGGRAVTLAIAPDIWHGIVGGATQPFVVSGIDAEGNATTDVGDVGFAVTGPIRAIDAASGVFTPTVAGQGTVSATSSHGPSVATRNLLVSNPNATLTIQSVRVSDTFYWGATTRIEVDVRSNDVADVVLTGLGFSFTTSGGSDLAGQLSLVADNTNLDRIAAGVTQTLVYYLSIAVAATYEGTVYVNPRGEAFNSAGNALALTSTVSSVLQNPTWGTALTIDAPLPPAEHACTGGRIAFRATASSLFTYTWRFPEGTLAPGSSLTDRGPSVDYNAVGSKTYSVTASYTFLFTTFPTLLLGNPVYIGTSTSVAADTYPTGRVVFSSPTAAQSVSLASFPRSNLITLDPALPVRQCNNTAVAATGHTALTLFSDRKLIDPAADVDPAAPGIQLKLSAQGGLPSLPLLAPSSQNEGATTVYAEYFEPQSAKVTAAGDVTFNLTNDTQAPSVSWTLPASDCATACLKTRDPLVFQFSEPLTSASLTNVLVDSYAGSACTGTFSDWTGSTTLRYDSADKALYVTTPMRTGSYAVRVRLPATITDAATARNALPATSRCVVFSSLADASAAATPQLIAAPSGSFSPDGDQSAELVTWNVTADAATNLLRLRILRGNQVVWGRLQPVTQAGPYSFVWDGADAHGRIVNNGAYSYTIEALNRAGVASTALRGYVEVASSVRMVSLRRRQ